MRYFIYLLALSGCLVGAALAEEPCLGDAQQCEPADQSKAAQSPQNLLETPLTECSTRPLTGWFRDGYCRTGANDTGRHVVCAEMTEDFLAFTKGRGNDLSTPNPKYRFPGLKPGDQWCLCALRWKEAQLSGAAPKVIAEATHQAAIRYVERQTLLAHDKKRASK